MKNNIILKSLATAVMILATAFNSPAPVNLTYNLATGANGGTNTLLTNAIILNSITVINYSTNNLIFSIFDSPVRTNAYAVAAYTNYSRSVAWVTNVYTNINIGNSTDTVSTNIYQAIVVTTNTDLATNRNYKITYAGYSGTNTTVTFPVNALQVHGMTITNNIIGSGVTMIFNYSDTR